jgi:hypothetical protein
VIFEFEPDRIHRISATCAEFVNPALTSSETNSHAVHVGEHLVHAMHNGGGTGRVAHCGNHVIDDVQVVDLDHVRGG